MEYCARIRFVFLVSMKLVIFRKEAWHFLKLCHHTYCLYVWL